jgi:hypothetical protein
MYTPAFSDEDYRALIRAAAAAWQVDCARQALDDETIPVSDLAARAQAVATWQELDAAQHLAQRAAQEEEDDAAA